MSTGGVFKLLVNDGKADRMILATKLLYNRIQDIMYMRTKQGRDDITPTLVDLERTHVIFVNAHFKPFAAIGYEYQKIQSYSGLPMFGSTVTFSIPQYGDFFHDMVCRVRLDAIQAAQGTLPTQSNSTVYFPLDNAARSAAIGTFYNIVDSFGNVLVVGTNDNPTTQTAKYRNFVRYCENPGNVLFQSVSFDVNGNPLDQYDWTTSLMLEKFTTTPTKRAGYNTLVGQQNPLQGVSGVRQCIAYDYNNSKPYWINQPVAKKTVASAGVYTGPLSEGVVTFNTPNTITKFSAQQSNQTVDLFQAAGTGQGVQTTAANATDGWSGEAPQAVYSFALTPATQTIAYSTLDTYATAASAGASSITDDYYAQNLTNFAQQSVSYTNGPQTPKPVQAPLEIWNKLKFWFNDDVRLSIPSVSIPFGQRFINIQLATQNQLVYEYPSIFVESIQQFDTNQQVRTYQPVWQLNGLLPSSTPITIMELYINNIFVNPEVHDIFIRRIGFALIRVYRMQQTSLNSQGQQNVLLSALKWPVEYMLVGLQPQFNVKAPSTTNYTLNGGNPNIWRDWHHLSAQLECTDLDFTIATPSSDIDAGAAISAGRTAVDPNKYYTSVQTIDSLGVTSHGIVIYDQYGDIFYNRYLPYHYGEEKVVTPLDEGAYLINMCLFPRSYQPSGHLNISRARETYLVINSTYLTANTACTLLVVAICINFLLISDGSAVIRYST